MVVPGIEAKRFDPPVVLFRVRCRGGGGHFSPYLFSLSRKVDGFMFSAAAAADFILGDPGASSGRVSNPEGDRV